jgi:hypothetical protein
MTATGTGVVGYTGDGGAAIAATLASPSAVAYDASGNLYLADAQNHAIREISKSGQMTTVAGAGVEGYGGDGGAATAAYLDTPTGIAIDKSGNLYIADSHNNRIREVIAGTISTIAGTGTPGFFGDAGVATAAQLSLPSAVAVDGNGNVYIADTNNQRIRKIAGTTITTIAGDGEETYAGDGAAAALAVLDSPTGVAVDAAGNVYIADRHNQRVRMVTLAGTISTIAGGGVPSFSGGFSGDGAAASAALLSKPSGVSIDAAGNIYIADTDNHRIRQVSGGTVGTVAGSGEQGYGGDGGPATAAILNSPRAVAPDALGNLTIADTLNQRLRTLALPTLIYTNDGVGILSTPQSVTLANSGSAAITVASINFTGAFTTAPGGSCSAVPITLAAGADCTQNIAFLPVATGSASGSVVFGGSGVVSQSILLAGSGAQTTTTVTLASSSVSAFVGQAITFTALVKPVGVGTPTGNVLFYDGAVPLGTSPLVSGTASFTTTLVAGANNITVTYSGDANFTGNASTGLTESILDFNFALGGASSSQTVEPGLAATFAFNLSPLGGPFTLPITLSASGLPPGAMVKFTPQTVSLGANPSNFTMAIQTAATGASVYSNRPFGTGYGTEAIALGLLLLPFSCSVRRRVRAMRLLRLFAALLLAFAVIGGISGCGSSSGFFGQVQRTYTINVVATATGSGQATLQHSSTVTLTVE